MRLPVTPQISTKDGVSAKNARLTNCLKETTKRGDLAVVRPGLVLDAQASGVGNGLVVFNNELVSVYGSTVGVGVTPGSSLVTTYTEPTPSTEWRTVDYLNDEYITFIFVTATGELTTFVGDGTSFGTASYGLITGNEAITAALSATAYVVVTRDGGDGYGSFMEVYRTAVGGIPSFSMVKSSNSYSCLRGDCAYLNGRFIIPCEDVGGVIGARIYSSSDDGATWISTNIAGFRPGGCTWDGTRWIIYGSDLDDTNPKAYYSTDLITFNALTLSGLSPDYIPLRIEKINGVYLARCYSATQTLQDMLYSSSDGIAWASATGAAFEMVQAIKTIGSYVYIGGTDEIFPYSNPRILRTIDGVIWETVCDPTGSFAHDLASDGTNLVGVSLTNANWFNNVVTASSIPTVGTITGSNFDFAQSPL